MWPWASQVALVVKNPPAKAGDIRDMSSISGSGRSPGEGHGNPLQCSCLKNPRDRGVWRASVHWVTKSWTQVKWLSRHTCTMCHIYYDLVIVLTVLYIRYLTYILYQPRKESIISIISKTVTQRSNVNCPEVFWGCVNGWLRSWYRNIQFQGTYSYAHPTLTPCFLYQVISIKSMGWDL